MMLWRNTLPEVTVPAGTTPQRMSDADQRDFSLNGIVITAHHDTSFVLINEATGQKKYRLNDALASHPDIFIRKINKTNIVVERGGHFERINLLPPSANVGTQRNENEQYNLADFIIATPIRDGETLHGLRLQPRTGLNGFSATRLEPGDVAIRLNNLSLTNENSVAQALSTLLSQQSVQLTVRRAGVPHLINISVNEFVGDQR